MTTELDKTKPIVQKLEFSKEDQANIDALIQGQPAKDVIKFWKNQGMDVPTRIKRYTCPGLKQRLRTIAHTYNIGTCHHCQLMPHYKIIFPLDGIQLIEYWCSDHLPKEFS